ncbi:PREDICTED: SUN domain-containing protein 3-like [Cyprinodon variegatus]|uniref:SUN domain-containing protein 3-like n=1 Tax=Cyprinodon variegatus TaxID=28743 RepID=UPI000742A196|nr:PREDICTED: SUN domain-containing protein 3-like [Cyprinodon variegatus]
MPQRPVDPEMPQRPVDPEMPQRPVDPEMQHSSYDPYEEYFDNNIVIQGVSHPLPGKCWPFGGSKGRISISLPNNVLISHVSLNHIPKRISIHGTISSAPKEFSIYGKKDLESDESLLGTFLYDEDGDQLQIFKLPDYVTGSFRYITLQVKSNWGNPDYTCLYGFRVHGKLEK